MPVGFHTMADYAAAISPLKLQACTAFVFVIITTTPCILMMAQDFMAFKPGLVLFYLPQKLNAYKCRGTGRTPPALATFGFAAAPATALKSSEAIKTTINSIFDFRFV